MQANAGKVLASAAALRLIPAHLVPKLARDTGVNHSSRKAVLETHHRVRHVSLLDQGCCSLFKPGVISTTWITSKAVSYWRIQNIFIRPSPHFRVPVGK